MKASVTKAAESKPWPMNVELMVRAQSIRPAVATFRRERTMEFANSPTR